MRAPARQQTSLEKSSGRQRGASVPLGRESPITNTLRAFLVALVLMRVGSWVSFAWLACPGSCPLLTGSSDSNPRASCLLRRDASGDGGGFFLLPRAQTSVPSPSSRELLVSVSSRLDSGLPPLARKGISTGPYHTAIDKVLQRELDASNTLHCAETTLVWHACSVTYGIF